MSITGRHTFNAGTLGTVVGFKDDSMWPYRVRFSTVRRSPICLSRDEFTLLRRRGGRGKR